MLYQPLGEEPGHKARIWKQLDTEGGRAIRGAISKCSNGGVKLLLPPVIRAA